MLKDIGWLMYMYTTTTDIKHKKSVKIYWYKILWYATKIEQYATVQIEVKWYNAG